MTLQRESRSALRWSPRPASLVLGPGDVHLLSASLDQAAERLPQLRATLSQAELERAARFAFPEDQIRFMTGRGLVREILGVYTEQSPQRLALTAQAQGKPELAGTRADRLEFNVAHSDSQLIVAVTRHGPVGVDIEVIRPLSDQAQMAALVFSEAEQREWETLPPAERARAFFDCWTRKEAFLKGRGEGLAESPQKIHVSLRRAGPAEWLPVGESGAEVSGWALCSLSASSFAITVAVKNPPVRVSHWDWQMV